MGVVSYIDQGLQVLMSTFSISGVDWVASTAGSTGRPSVASMSLGGSTFEPVDLAVANVTGLSSFVRSSAHALDSWLLPAFPPPSLVSRYARE